MENLENKYKGYKNYSIYLFIFVLIISLYNAYTLHFLSGEAFIAFRYAKNLYYGYGFVFNPTEYTSPPQSFLWVNLIYLGMKLGISPERSSQGMGLLSFILTILLLFIAGERLHKKKYHSGRLYIPLAALSYPAMLHSRIYATSGTEISLFILLILSGTLIILIFNNRESILIGLIFISFSCITRNEGLIFYFTITVFLFIFKNKEYNLKNIIRKDFIIHLPFILIVLPFIIWKYLYYTDLESMVVNQNIQIQGNLTHLREFFKTYYILPIMVLYLAVVFINKIFFNLQFKKKIELKVFQRNSWLSKYRYKLYFKPNKKKINFDYSTKDKTFEWILIAVLPSLLSLLLIIYNENEKGFGKLPIVLVPFILFGIEMALLEEYNAIKVLFITLCIFLSLYFHNPSYTVNKELQTYGIRDENKIFQLKEIYKKKLKLLRIRKIFSENLVRISTTSEKTYISYYLDPLIVLDLNKTFQFHNKESIEPEILLDFLQKRRIHLFLDDLEILESKEYNRFEYDGFGEKWKIIIYEDGIMDEFQKNKKLVFKNFQEYLNSYLSKIKEKSTPELKKDLMDFKNYYFLWNKDRGKLELIESEIHKRNNDKKL